MSASSHSIKCRGDTVTEDLSSMERYILSQISWNALAKLTAEDEAACRRLEAEGLLTKSLTGRGR